MKEFELNNIMDAFTNSLADATGIDSESAEKVIKWLALEGVLDFPVIVEDIKEVA